MEAENRDKFYTLAAELEREDAEKYRAVIHNLTHLEYDDFENDRFAAPKTQMAADFEALGRPDIAQRVRDGEFDQ